MDAESLAEWAARWRRLGPELEALRLRESESADVATTMELLEDAFQAALRSHPPQPGSGLVEQQRWFRRLAEKQRDATGTGAAERVCEARRRAGDGSSRKHRLCAAARGPIVLDSVE
jgi:hypothetical protein